MVLPSRVVRMLCQGSRNRDAASRSSTKSGPISSPKSPLAARYSSEVRSGVPGRTISGFNRYISVNRLLVATNICSSSTMQNPSGMSFTAALNCSYCWRNSAR